MKSEDKAALMESLVKDASIWKEAVISKNERTLIKRINALIQKCRCELEVSKGDKYYVNELNAKIEAYREVKNTIFFIIKSKT